MVRGEGGDLRVSLSFDRGRGERILLLEEIPTPTPAMLRGLGLTEREAEILFWAAQGKSDAAIAVLCGISPRTVQIHLAHVYAKLGVENRTSAALAAVEFLRP